MDTGERRCFEADVLRELIEANDRRYMQKFHDMEHATELALAATSASISRGTIGWALALSGLSLVIAAITLLISLRPSTQ